MNYFFGYFSKKLNRFLQIDSSYFIKGGFWNTVQQILGVIAGLFISFLFGHFVSKQVFGEYNLILSIISMVTFLSLPGIDTVLIRSTGQEYDGSLNKALRMKIKFSLLGVPVLLSFAAFHFFYQNSTLSFPLIITALCYPFLNSFVIYRSFLTAKHRFDLLAYLSIFSSIVFLGITSISIFFFPTTSGIMTGYLLGIIIPSAAAYWYAKRFKKNNKVDKMLFGYSFFLTSLSIIPWISGNLGSIMLAHLAGTETLAVFSVASRFFTAIQKNFVAFHKPISAKLAYQSEKEHYQSLKIHWWKFLCMGFGLTILLWFSSPILINFFFTEKYREAIILGQILSLALFPLPISWMLDDIVVYQKKKTPQLISSIIPGIIKIGLYFALIPRFGVLGLVWIIVFDRFTAPLIPLYFLFADKTPKK